jgi:beta-mannosidase
MSKAIARRVISLDGAWEYTQDPDETGEARRLYDPSTSREGWEEMTIPVNWYNTDVGNYHGVVWFARKFAVPGDVAGREVLLRFNAVDYIGDVWLNGAYLGRHEGFFAPFEFRVGGHVREGENTLIVRVDSPYDETEYRYVPEAPGEERPLTDPYRVMKPVALTTIKGSLIDFWHRPGFQTQFGQDGNTGGIWQSVDLVVTGSLTVDGVLIQPRLVRRNGTLDGTALVVADVDVYNGAGETVRSEVGIEAGGKNFEGGEEIRRSKQVVLTPGANTVKLVCTVQEPVLWWCWDHGEPSLYRARVWASLDGEVQDEVEETFGIRELVMGDEGHWILNGRRVFARGMRYLSSIWLAEADEALFREDLDRMRAFNVNAIRIGSHVEQPRFYELCDEMGFLLWQVFPLHWGNYADSDELIERAATMMAEMVHLLYNHASIVIWSVFKEPNVYPFEPRPNLYGRLCEVMAEAARRVDPVRWVHKGDYGEGVRNVMTGGWGEMYVDFRQLAGGGDPQKVEYGTVALAPLETLTRILTPEETWPPDWNRWAYLNVDPIWPGLQGIDVDALSGIEEMVERSQSWAARQIKESIEFLRQRKYDPNASMFLYFWSDPWPCVYGSGLLDYYRNEYKAYDAFGKVYTPVLVSVEWLLGKHLVGFEKAYAPGALLRARIWVTNDLYREYADASLRWWIEGPNGKETEAHCRSVGVPEDSSRVVENVRWRIPPGAQGDYRIEVELESAEGETLSTNYFAFKVTGEPFVGGAGPVDFRADGGGGFVK